MKFLRQILALLLLIAFTAQTFGQSFIVFDYVANQEWYKKQCINKDKPKLQCKGKCQMLKKMKEEEKKEERSKGSKADVKDQVLSSKSFFASLPPYAAIAVTGKLHLYNEKVPSNFSDGIFRPPCFHC